MSNARDTLVAAFLREDYIFGDTFRDIVKWLSERYPDGTFELTFNASMHFKVEFERSNHRYFMMVEVIDHGYDDVIDLNIKRMVKLQGRATISLDKRYLIDREDHSSSSLINSLELFDKNVELKFVHQELVKNPGIIQAGV